MSPYMYCAGNPVMMVDPDGRESEKFGDGFRSFFRKIGNLVKTGEWKDPNLDPGPYKQYQYDDGRLSGIPIKTMLNTFVFTSELPRKQGKQATNTVKETGLPTIGGQTAPWSPEYIAENTMKILANPTVGVVANITDDVLKCTKGMGHFATGLSVANDSYHYFILEDINAGRYIYRLTGAGAGTALTILGSEATPIVGPSVLFYEKTYDYIKSTYENLYDRLNSLEWWGGQYGY